MYKYKAHIVIPVKLLYQSKAKLNIIFSTCVNQVNLHNQSIEQSACCVNALVQFYSSTPTAYTLTFSSNFRSTPMFM